MSKQKVHASTHLTITVDENDTSIKVIWKGKSIDREPSKFISPILVEVLDSAYSLNKRIVMDFQELTYMNSSTVTPIIKILERARKSVNKISIFYQKKTKWQELSFSALKIFSTEDNRLEIEGL